MHNHTHYWINTQCRSTFILSKNDIKKYGNYDIAFFIENFSYDKNIMKEFLKNLNFKMMFDTNTSTYNYIATGKNNIVLFFKKTDYTGRPVNSQLYNINIDLINKIFENNKKIIGYNNQKYEIYYTYDFINKYFNIGNIYDYLIVDNHELYYIMIDLTKSYFNKAPNKENINSINIGDFTFIVILKCQNYNKYKNVTNINFDNFIEINKILSNSNYRNIFYYERNDIEILKKIKSEIESFFTNKYNLLKDNIQITLIVASLNVNMWTPIYVRVNRYNIGEYSYNRLTLSLNSIIIQDLLDLCEYNEYNKISDILTDKYKISIPYYMNIYKKNINDIDNYYRLHSRKNTVNIFLENNKNKHYIEPNINSEKLDVIIDNHKFSDEFINNIIIHRITDIKDTQFITMCSKSICLSFKNDYYVINIIPRTIEYVNFLSRTVNIMNYITNNYTKKSNDDYLHIKHNNLLYIIEIIKINPYDCSCCDSDFNKKANLLSKYVKNHIISSHKQSLYLILKETFDISNILLDIYKNNFVMSLFTIIHNIIKNLLIYMINSTDDSEAKHNNYIYIKNKIIDLETMYNNLVDNKYKNTIFTFHLELLYNENTRTLDSEFFILKNNNSFYCVPVNEYIEYKYKLKKGMIVEEYPYKLLIWYTEPLINNIIKIKSCVDNIYDYVCEYITKNIIDSKLSLIKIKQDQLRIIYKDIDVKQYISNFLYNICSLVEHSDKKKELDDFLILVITTLGKKLISVLYHYYTGLDTLGLHLHIVPKVYTYSSAQPQKILGVRGNFSHDINRYYAHDYYKFNNTRQNFLQYTNCRIFCIKSFQIFIKKYLKKHNKYDIYETNDIYNILVEGMKNDELNNPFSDLLKDDSIKDYLYKLIEFNKDTIIRIFDTIIKFSPL
jgi:hypothetical protein